MSAGVVVPGEELEDADDGEVLNDEEEEDELGSGQTLPYFFRLITLIFCLITLVFRLITLNVV